MKQGRKNILNDTDSAKNDAFNKVITIIIWKYVSIKWNG